VAQFARPDSTINLGLWGETGAATLYEAIDEISANDFTDYITAGDPVQDICDLGLSAVSDPSSSAGHIIRVKAMAPSGFALLTVTLFEGASARASFAVNPVTSIFTVYDYTLSGAEADSITNYSNLAIQFDAVGGGVDPVSITWHEVEFPDAGSPPDPVIGSAGQFDPDLILEAWF